jgi:hypothetical protein
VSPGPRHAALALAAAAALFAAKNMRHADEAQFAIGPAARMSIHEVQDGHATDALTAADIIAEKKEDRRQQ